MGAFVPLPEEIEIIPRDTTPEAFRVQIEALRRLGMEGRLRMMLELCRNVRKLAAAGVRMRHPEFNEDQVQLAVARLVMGEETFAKLPINIEVNCERA
jgi:hypothetical protein